MSAPLPPEFLGAPLAHRGLHVPGRHRPENSRAAFRAAIEAGYGIELDIQMSRDGQAMVFHDYHLGRLTAARGAIGQMDAAQLRRTHLLGTDEGIPTLAEVLALVAGQVALLVEIKDQDGALGPDVGSLEAAVAAALAGYSGPVAVMSFNPHSVARVGQLAPHLPLGLTTCSYRMSDWRLVPKKTRKRLRLIPDFAAVGAQFISHKARDLRRPRVTELKAAGVPVLCWTVRSPKAEAKARRVADNITFEGYAAALPAP